MTISSTPMVRWRMAPVLVPACFALLLHGCTPSPSDPPAISLVRAFDSAAVTDSPTVPAQFDALVLGFGEDATIPEPEDAGSRRGWKAMHDVAALRLQDGKLRGRMTGEDALFYVGIPEDTFPDDLLGAVEIDINVSAGRQIGVFLFRDAEFDEEFETEFFQFLDETDGQADFVVDIEPGEAQTVRLTESDSPRARSEPLGPTRNFGIIVFGGEGGEFELEAVRFESRTQVLAQIPAGFGWHGLGSIYRETVVTRSPERVTWTVDLGDHPWLDLVIGSPEAHPATYHVEVRADGTDPVQFARTLTAKDLWNPITLDLGVMAGRSAEIEFRLETEEPGRIGFWGNPAIRHRGAVPAVEAPSPARAALSDAGAPRGVIVMLADTLRPDHLDAWGYQERVTAPNLSRLLSQGTRFDDNISQGTWTKIAVPAVLTSLYASTHGIVDVPDRLPASVTTMAEAFRESGYATWHSSSVLFSGRNSNLQQGVEVLHEKSSVTDGGDYPSKTARTYVSRLIDWLEVHRDQPFFVFLHVFDPHSPFRPREPYDRRWLDEAALAQHETDLEAVDEVVEIFHDLPTAEELEKAEVDADRFIAAEKAWYDASIRAMDVEIQRLFERLGEWGLADDTLFAFVADHGEEFLEHGRSWHGHSVYGEMINVPMAMRWPGVVPEGLVVERPTQSIDLMPTLLELARVEIPEQAQGRSLVPLLADPSGFAERWPVFSERKNPSSEDTEGSPDAYTVIHEGWKLIWNVIVRDDRPEFELFDHEADPLNLTNLAEEQPERVERLKRLIEGWKTEVEAARVSDEGLEEELSPEELRELRALGYIN